MTKCGPSLLPSILTYSTRSSSSPPSLERLVQQRGYTPQDIEACVQLRRSLDKAGENGLDIHDLYQTHTHLDEPQSGRTRSLQQYMKVNTSTHTEILPYKAKTLTSGQNLLRPESKFLSSVYYYAILKTASKMCSKYQIYFFRESCYGFVFGKARKKVQRFVYVCILTDLPCLVTVTNL